MALYFNITDLQARLTRTTCWIADEALKQSNRAKYYGKLDDCFIKLQYVVAALEAIQCYTPITSEDEDGIINCLTEEQAEQIFDNISNITDICFLPKNTIYTTSEVDDIAQTTTLNSGGSLTQNAGGALNYNFFSKEPIPKS